MGPTEIAKVADAYGELDALSNYLDDIVKNSGDVVSALKKQLKANSDSDGLKKAVAAAEDLKKRGPVAQKGAKALFASLGEKHLAQFPAPKDYQLFVVAQALLKPLLEMRDSISRFKLAMDLGSGMHYCLDAPKVKSMMLYVVSYEKKLAALQTEARKLTS